MKNFLLVFILFTATVGFAQKVDKNAITGNWVVTNVTITSNFQEAEMRKLMEVMKKGYQNSRFHFKPDGKFTIEFQKDSPDFMNHLKILNNKDWKFSEREQLISVGTKQDNYNHLRLYVKNNGESFLFAFSDTPLILEMVKK